MDSTQQKCSIDTISFRAVLEAEIETLGLNIKTIPVHEVPTLVSLSGIDVVYDMGKAVIALSFQADTPRVFVAEKKLRLDLKSGESVIKEHVVLKDGSISLKRVAHSAYMLSLKLSDVPKKRELPKGMLVTPSSDDNYHIHIPLLQVRADQLKKIINILRDEPETQHEPQPVFDNTTVEDIEKTGEGGGEGMASVESACQEAGSEGAVVAGA